MIKTPDSLDPGQHGYYHVSVVCDNCGEVCKNFKISRGLLVSQAICTNCGCIDVLEHTTDLEDLKKELKEDE